jgi:hypothetical protein
MYFAVNNNNKSNLGLNSVEATSDPEESKKQLNVWLTELITAELQHLLGDIGELIISNL